MTQFETLVNPPQQVWDQVVKQTSDTEAWAFLNEDYKMWQGVYDQFWLVTVVEKGTFNFVASVTLARWDSPENSLYTIGMFYCNQKYRGQGHGKPIFQKVMDIIGDKNAALTGALKMSDKYDKVFGFNKYPEYFHFYSNLKIENLVIPQKVSENYSTKALSDVDYEALTAYDKTICPKDRKKIMAAWFKGTFTRVVFDKSGKIVGYGTFRLVSDNRLSPAPFYADNIEAAEVLLKEILENIPNLQNYSSFAFLYPECNQDALKVLEKFAKNKDEIATSKCLRMQFTKELIPTPDHKVYAVSDIAHQFV